MENSSTIRKSEAIDKYFYQAPIFFIIYFCTIKFGFFFFLFIALSNTGIKEQKDNLVIDLRGTL